MKNFKTTILVAISLLVMLAVKSSGQNISVTNSTQLQAALDTARTNGEDDTIYLEIGTYTTAGSPFTYGIASNDNHSITLSGGWYHLNPGWQYNEPELTVLDGNSLNPVLQIDSNMPGVNITFNIENLTIQNGYARSADYSGAGILAFTGQAGSGSINVTIQDCIFQNNNAANNKSGGAIYSMGSIEVYDSRFLSNTAYNGGAIVLAYDIDDSQSAAPVLENCYFEDNSNYGNQGSTIWTNCAPQIRNCTFKGRTNGSSSGNGSCIWGNNGSHLNIVNSVFSDITIKYWGSAVQTWYSDTDITNCLFANNHAGVGGDGYGAIAFLSSTNSVNITNCTFSGNTDVSTYSGAINNRGAIVNLNNCIFWDNDGATGVYNESGTTTMRYCLYDNGSMGYGVTDGGNNIYQNPMFIDDDVFRLSAYSPCIDAGNNDLVPADIQDVDDDDDTTEAIPLDVAGKARFRDDPFTEDTGIGTGPIVDIGAYEFVQTGRFGYVNDKKNVKLTLKGSDHNDVTFALSGAPYAYGTIDPCDPTFELIEIYNDNDGAEKAALTITTKSKSGSSVGSINCFGPMKSITAKNIDLLGDISIGSTSNPKAAVTIVFDQGHDLNINSEMPVKSISSYDWWGSLTAPSVGSISAKANHKLDKWGYLDLDIDVAGAVGTVSATDGIDGSWNCKSVKSITAYSTDDFYLTLSQEPNVKVPALGKLTVKANFAWSQIISAGNIGTITLGLMENSCCFAGVSPAYAVDESPADDVLDLPPVLGDTFNQQATIKSFTVKGVKSDDPGYFTNSNIAAYNINTVFIAYPDYANSGIPFGVTMFNSYPILKKFTIKDDEKTHAWKGIDIGEASDWLTTMNYDMQIRRD